MMGILTISKNKEKIFEETEIGGYYYFGSTFDYDKKDVYSGTNITGNKIPNLLISKWTGGAHCCNSLFIFELGKAFRLIDVIESGSYQTSLIDVDSDGIPEIEFLDGSIDYLFASFAGSPAARVILKYKDDHYEVAPQLMERPLPSQKILARKCAEITAALEPEAPELPYKFLQLMMNLSYSGHIKDALSLAEKCWPQKKPGLLTFKTKFLDALNKSRYWPKP
jgi:hypothetical protein